MLDHRLVNSASSLLVQLDGRKFLLEWISNLWGVQGNDTVYSEILKMGPEHVQNQVMVISASLFIYGLFNGGDPYAGVIK